MAPTRKICAIGGTATAAPAPALMIGRRAALAVAEFRFLTRSQAPSVCEARAASPVLLALRAVRLIGARRRSVTRNLPADRYTAQRNGQGMFQLQ